MAKHPTIIITHLNLENSEHGLLSADLRGVPYPVADPIGIDTGVVYELRTPKPIRTEKRCKSRSINFNEHRCNKSRGHVKRGDPAHTNGPLIWGVHGAGTNEADPAPCCAYHDSIDPESPARRAFFGPSMAAPDRAQALIDWWMGSAQDEIERTVPKSVEYGSTDLIDIGLMLAKTMKRTVNEEEAAELGVFFYLIGKIARWQSALERGDRPSDDTLLDIGVYVRMAQRIRHSGGWPGLKDETDTRHSACADPCGPDCNTEDPDE